MQRVICRFCHTEYDLGRVEVVARYAECTVFRTPCCGREVDDRPKSLPDFRKVEDVPYSDRMHDIMRELKREETQRNELRDRNRRRNKYI